MAVAENAGVKVDSSGQNLDNNNTAASATETTKPPCPDDDQSPKSDSSTPLTIDSTPETDDRINETAQKVQTLNGFSGNGERDNNGEIKDLADAFSKLNPMAQEFVPPSLARSQSGVLRNGLGFTNNFAAPPKLADGNDHFPRRRRSFGQGKRRMNKRTSLAQKDDVIRRTVYVSDIDQQVTEENLAGVFINCGQVVDCRVCGDPNSVLRFAFIEFTNEEGARAALSMSGTVLGFYPLKVLPSKTAIAPVNPTFLPRSEDEREMCVRTVYCTNIDKRITQIDLKGFFEMLCGEVHRLRLGDYHHQTRIAFVEFAMAESAIAALHCSGIVLGALPIRVSPSKTPVRPHFPRAEFK
ncbi:RNA-binding-like protein [Arabidopsis thaliana]|jgi:RNA recognition motif-containing protein|uniref:Polyadenylate-binding protein-interacting protein 10 n=3 Tax=Arabidopsis TaxID=3701 RepID=CID10_ARATH|nr:CTC-interacting domain 10 [Arabidopsis thaliana]NP_001325461.1 CTC-interacting domain 10 [Arabidopsis thaliana]NP_190508.1 CTC-interacting domain 10 [Arabidopsis thaliana]Q9SG10.1 RecName: Full=Polyadenylate-binding protein-interacting protein 10; Short=PABP-interacting protein 10; Short=Poly(A)-binding protein-interacting protein 10; AltName: Full=PAM2-containing protein CID10; AltName: Full=Protein CTC-INTERACTING DOMAIN 10 [Arabidopsis thaliana]KAG7633798.1 RNA recognition motif domain [A|eukprot:NP_001030833.1 CTC-interacting domain 10 [Arabidopsis thaliana]